MIILSLEICTSKSALKIIHFLKFENHLFFEWGNWQWLLMLLSNNIKLVNNFLVQSP